MSTSLPTDGHGSVHRIDALTDGIYAVAMTLLVIELKLPEAAKLPTEDATIEALVDLLPRLLAWAVSFAVMAVFWMGHHRVHARLRSLDPAIVRLNVGQLAFVSLMPFSCSLQGHGRGLVAEAVFAGNMAVLAMFSLALVRHVFRHPALCAHPMPLASYRAARLRVGGLIVLSGLSVLLQMVSPPGAYGLGNVAFIMMALLGRISGRMERRAVRAAGEPPLSATR